MRELERTRLLDNVLFFFFFDGKLVENETKLNSLYQVVNHYMKTLTSLEHFLLYYLIINLCFAVENYMWGIRQLASNKNKNVMQN